MGPARYFHKALPPAADDRAWLKGGADDPGRAAALGTGENDLIPLRALPQGHPPLFSLSAFPKQRYVADVRGREGRLIQVIHG